MISHPYQLTKKGQTAERHAGLHACSECKLITATAANFFALYYSSSATDYTLQHPESCSNVRRTDQCIQELADTPTSHHTAYINMYGYLYAHMHSKLS
jgi:hypothetical protein